MPPARVALTQVPRGKLRVRILARTRLTKQEIVPYVELLLSLGI